MAHPLWLPCHSGALATSEVIEAPLWFWDLLAAVPPNAPFPWVGHVPGDQVAEDMVQEETGERSWRPEHTPT